jgi:predicted glycosyltransferase
MRYLVFTNTPAHVHLYRNAVRELLNRGHDIIVLARDYAYTLQLLEWYEYPYKVYGVCDTTPYSLFKRLRSHYARIVRHARAFDPDLIFGMGSYATHASTITRTRTVLLLDSEPTTVDHLVSRPFADALLTPATFRKDLEADHYVFGGFNETAYLHPETFSPDPSVRDRLGVGDDDYIIVQFNAFGSHHDVGEGGFSPEQCRLLVTNLAESATVFVSDKGGNIDFDEVLARPYDLHPALMHDALAEASLVVTDTQTLATEAALLGTPTVRSNSFVGKSDMSNFVELGEADLIENLQEFDEVRATALALLKSDDGAETLRHLREEYLAGLVNLTRVTVDVATNPTDLESVDSLARRASDEAEETTDTATKTVSVKP